MIAKSETLSKFLQFQKSTELHTGERVKLLRSGNGGQHISTTFLSHLLTHRIHRRCTVARTAQQNGVADRFNCTALILVRSMILHHSTEKRFWAESLDTDIYVRNCVTSPSLAPKRTLTTPGTIPHLTYRTFAPLATHDGTLLRP